MMPARFTTDLPKFLFFLSGALLCLTGCYEDQIACLDPDAANYDLSADEACPDGCCNYPELSITVNRLWGAEPFSADSIYRDGAGNAFRLVRLRFYLGDLSLKTNDAPLPTPERIIEIDRAGGGDTMTVEINANVALLGTATGSSSVIGDYRRGLADIAGLEGTLGLGPDFASLVPASAPAASPLLTQPGLLNFRDGRGYLQASLEYQVIGQDTLRADVYGLDPFSLDLPGPVLPQRGEGLRLLLNIDYEAILGGIDLAARPEDFATFILSGLQLTGAQ